MHLATFNLYRPKWSRAIQDQWKNSLIKRRPDLTTVQIDRIILEMNKSFPDANVEQFESLIPKLDLPDKKDNHVLAAAVSCGAELIVTFNLKHFPIKNLKEFDIEVQHPDIFISGMIQLYPEKSIEAFIQQVSFLKNPTMTASQVLTSLEKVQLFHTCKELRARIKPI